MGNNQRRSDVFRESDFDQAIHIGYQLTAAYR